MALAVHVIPKKDYNITKCPSNRYQEKIIEGQA
jgi:hypothetical protein